MPQRPVGELFRSRKFRLYSADRRCAEEITWSPFNVSIVSWKFGLLDPSVGILFSMVSNAGSVIGASSRILAATGLQRAFGMIFPGNGSRTHVLPTSRDVLG